MRAALIEAWGEIMFSKKTHGVLVVICILLLFSGCRTVVSDFRQSISSPRAELQADEAYASGDYSKAFPLYLESAEAGRGYSQFMVANMYLNGEGTPMNEAAGVEWMHTAAEGGYPPAIYGLGLFNLFGFEGEPDEVSAATYFEKAAKQEHGLSMLALGKMHALGIGVEKDIDEAVRWFRLARANGLPVDDELLVDPEEVFERILKAHTPRETVPVSIGPKEQLVQVQQQLNELGYNLGQADGVMGPKTRNAIREFQKEVGLSANGEVTEGTIYVLDLIFE